jgi:hypothetical protein
MGRVKEQCIRKSSISQGQEVKCSSLDFIPLGGFTEVVWIERRRFGVARRAVLVLSLERCSYPRNQNVSVAVIDSYDTHA